MCHQEQLCDTVGWLMFGMKSAVMIFKKNQWPLPCSASRECTPWHRKFLPQLL